MKMFEIRSPKDVERLVNQMGFLPFFRNEIKGFSIEESTAKEYWFADDEDGVWEWKGTVIAEGDCAYGKFYQNRACYISMDWFPDFMNYRRNEYALTLQEQFILDTLKEQKSLLSKELKKKCGYVKPKTSRIFNPIERLLLKEMTEVTKSQKSQKESFETAITRLQMSTQIITADFEYQYDKKGKRYGWGVARYCTPEDFFGEERFMMNRTPKESKERINMHLHEMLPNATDTQINDIIG